MERSACTPRVFMPRPPSSKPEVARVQLSAEFPLPDYYGFIIQYTKKQVRFCLPLVLCLIEPVLGGERVPWSGISGFRRLWHGQTRPFVPQTVIFYATKV